MYYSVPIFEVNPLSEDEFILENLKQDVRKAREQAKKGELMTTNQVCKKLGIYKF